MKNHSKSTDFVRLRDAGCALLLVALACWFAWDVLWARSLRGQSIPSYDIYAYYYPNVVYALRSLQEGHGLLWNSLQNCGQPFFANPQIPLLYPPNWIFLVLEVNSGILALTVFHLSIGAIGSYALCRRLSLDRLPALAGAISYELGGSSLGLAAWMPNISAAYAWMPLAVYFCESALRQGTIASSMLLGAVLAMQLLAGYPQVAFFTYLILFARLVWSIATKEKPGWRSIGMVALGMATAPMLAAVHLIPGAELARESVRGGSLSAAERNAFVITWEMFRTLVRDRVTGPGTTLTLVTCGLAGVALARRARSACFFGFLLFLFLSLSFDNVLSRTYGALPLATVFRGSDRYLWPAGFCLSVLVALGLDALRRKESDETQAPRSHFLLVRFGGLILGGLAYSWLTAGALRPWEWALSLTLAGATLWAAVDDEQRRATYTILAVVLLGALGLAGDPIHGLKSDASATLEHNEGAFASVAKRMTNEHRLVVVGQNSDYSLMPKSSTVFRLPGIGDYEPLTSRRYAEYYVKTVYGAANDLRMVSLNQFAYLEPAVPRNLPLLNLAAARFFVIDERLASSSPKVAAFSEIDKFDGLRVYENPAALPRAFFVPTIDVVPDRVEILRMLSSRSFDARSAALLPESPPDGYRGAARNTGSARIVEDLSEELTLQVFSSEGGFVFVSDQYYPGWTATVNGSPAPILLANYAFRLVRVPPGASEIVFRYRPASLLVGALISLTTLAMTALALLLPVMRRRA